MAKRNHEQGDHEAFIKEISSWDDEMVYSHLGSWIKISEDGTNWENQFEFLLQLHMGL